MELLWYDIRQLDEETMARTVSMMDEARRRRVSDIAGEDDRKRTVAGELLARRVLAQRLGCGEGEVPLRWDDTGKPAVDAGGVYVSVSHSGPYAVCAAADVPVGVDVEVVRSADEKFMRLALNEAEKALEEQEVPIGAVVVADGRIVGRGHNLVETLADATAHAEMQALTAAASTVGGKYLSECTLYVTVEPCIMCAGAIAWSQVGRVVYGADDPKRGYRRYSEQVFPPRTTVTRGVLAEECERLVRSFFAALRR